MLFRSFLAIIPKVDAAAMSGAMSSITSTLSSAAKTGAAAFGVMSAAATAAAGVLVKSSLDGYAAYEQNGGYQRALTTAAVEFFIGLHQASTIRSAATAAKRTKR